MKKILFTLIMASFASFVFAQSISNVSSKVIDNNVQISYKVSGLKYYQEISRVDIFVRIGDDDFIGPLKEISGEDMKGKSNGSYSVLWDALKEIPLSDEAFVFDVRLKVADKDRSRKLFVMLVGNDVTPLGIRVGQLGKTSWYFEARGSLLAMNTPTYAYDGNTVIDYEKTGYYEFTGTSGWQAYSAIVGVTQQISWNAFVYAGIGYGVENYVIETNEYDYNSSAPIGTVWTKYEEYSNSGVEIDAGLLYRYKKLLIGAGGTALNFKSFGWSVSVGMNF